MCLVRLIVKRFNELFLFGVWNSSSNLNYDDPTFKVHSTNTAVLYHMSNSQSNALYQRLVNIYM